MAPVLGMAVRKVAQRVTGIQLVGRCYSRYEAEPFMKGDVRRRDVWPKNPNKHKTVLDGADYTFIDGRPTPYGTRAVRRMEKQQQYTAQIMKHTREVDLAKATHKRMIMEKEQELKQIVDSKLKSKGKKVLEI